METLETTDDYIERPESFLKLTKAEKFAALLEEGYSEPEVEDIIEEFYNV